MGGRSVSVHTETSALHEYLCTPLTYNRAGLLDRPQKAWSQDGGNMRVFVNEVTCWPVLLCIFVHSKKWARMNNLFQVDENSIEQYFAANIVLGC